MLETGSVDERSSVWDSYILEKWKKVLEQLMSLYSGFVFWTWWTINN